MAKLEGNFPEAIKERRGSGAKTGIKEEFFFWLQDSKNPSTKKLMFASPVDGISEAEKVDNEQKLIPKYVSLFPNGACIRIA